MAVVENIIYKVETEGADKFKKDLQDAAKSQQELNNAVESGTNSVEEYNKAMNARKAQLAQLDKESKAYKELDAEIKAAEISVESLNKSTDTLKKQFADTKKAIDGVNYTMNELEKAGLKNTSTYQNLKTKLGELEKKGGELKDQIGDLNTTFKNLGSDTRGTDAAIEGLQGITAATQVVMGAQALFGTNSKELERTLVNLNGVMAIANGIKEIQTVLQKESAISTYALAAAQSAYNFVVNAGSVALGVFRAALIATGIGAVIAVVIAAVQAFKSFANQVDENAEAMKKAKEANKAYADSLDEDLKRAETRNQYQVKAGKDNVKAQKELTAELYLIWQQAYNDLDDLRQEKMRLEQKEIEDSEEARIKHGEDLAKITEDINKKQTDVNTKYYAYKNSLLEEDILKEKNIKEKGKKDKEELLKRENEALYRLQAEQLKAGQTSWTRYEIAIINQKAKIAKIETDSEAKRKLIDQQAIKDKEEALKKGLGQELNFIKERLVKVDEAKQPELVSEKKIFDAKKILQEQDLERQKKNAETIKALISSISEAQQSAFALMQQGVQNELQTQLEAIEQKKQAELSATDLTEKEKEAINKKYRAQEAAAKLKAWKTEQDIKKSQAIMNGALAATNIFANSVPLTWPILLGAVLLQTAAQVALIENQKPPKFEKGGSVAKRLGYINGKPHSAGGEIIEVEGNEFVFRKEAVKKYGVSMLEQMNNLQLAIPKEPSRAVAINYNKLGEVIGDKLRENPMLRVSIDKRGVNTSIGNTQIMNNYVDF